MYSAAVTAATQPLVWILTCLVIAWGLYRRQPPQFRRLVGFATALLVVSGWAPLPEYLLARWEGPVPGPEVRADKRLEGVVGLVVLGGMGDPRQIDRGHHHLQLNSAAERFTESLALARRFPQWKLLYTGGCGPSVDASDCRPEADAAGKLYVSLGLPPERLILESASSTTYENAVFSARVAGVDPRQRWLLVTSASHMRRAMATFRAAGWNVQPWPVDFEGVETPRWSDYSLGDGVRKWRILLHEWIGMAYYRIRSRGL